MRLPKGLRKGAVIGGEVIGWGTFCPRITVHQTKLAIVETIRRLDRPISAEKIRENLSKDVRQSVLDYHLCTLVKAGVVELVFDRPELQFQISEMSQA
jgi:DNA-binding transcriptional ArsR family regulator